jgi:tRNA threonylcarbamoyladenosine biosynthesis protein TsaE
MQDVILMEHSKNLPACKRSYPLQDETETHRFGAQLSTILQRGDCLLFYGDLGMGKTTLVRGILNGFARKDGMESLDVPSPTFTLVQIYDFSGVTCYHYDLYRLPEEDNDDALMEIGFAESCEDGIVLAEWPDRLGHSTPAHALRITLHDTANENGRICTIEGSAAWATRLESVKG